jgi:hypothetical protein
VPNAISGANLSGADDFVAGGCAGWTPQPMPIMKEINIDHRKMGFLIRITCLNPIEDFNNS